LNTETYGDSRLYYSRQTPFANGASDSPGQILQRISEGRVDLESGNWVSVSTEAKVRQYYSSVYLFE